MSLLHPGLEAFTAVVRHSTVRGAAAEIGLTQTGVTQRIRTLERKIGVTLFTRSRKGMRLTQEGEALHRYCLQVNDMEGELLSFLAGSEDAASHRLQVTGPSSIMRARVIPACLKVLERHPALVFTFDLDDERSGIEQLREGRSQLAVVPVEEVVNELDSRRLKPTRHILVGPRMWKGRPVREIVHEERIVDFSEGDDATFRYLKRHRLFGKARKDRHFANNIDALASMLATGCGYSVLSENFAAPLLEGRKIIELNPGKQIRLEFALAWYPRHEMPGYFRDVVKEIR